MRHADPRIYIGPRTNEVIVSLGRVYNTAMILDHPNVVMTVTRPNYEDQRDWVSYGVDQGGNAHFEIPDEFMIEAPKGFYIGCVAIANHQVARIEMIKAPSYYARSASAPTTDCKETKWVEPECVAPVETCDCDCEGELTVGCHCGFYFRDQCPSCSTKYITVRVNSKAGYGISALSSNKLPTPTTTPEN